MLDIPNVQFVRAHAELKAKRVQHALSRRKILVLLLASRFEIGRPTIGRDESVFERGDHRWRWICWCGRIYVNSAASPCAIMHSCFDVLLHTGMCAMGADVRRNRGRAEDRLVARCALRNVLALGRLFHSRSWRMGAMERADSGWRLRET